MILLLDWSFESELFTRTHVILKQARDFYAIV